jgi:hypothetical protein
MSVAEHGALRSRMIRKAVRICLIFLTGILLFGLSSMEIPELSKLTDDVSNDFISAASINELAFQTAATREQEAPRKEVQGTDRRAYAFFLPISITTPRITYDLFLLFSVQRK